MKPIPVVLFAYARPAHLARVLACLRREAVPLIFAFADGAKGASDAAEVGETRRLLREATWCELHLTERAANLGLGGNVVAGVTEVAAGHEAFIVWEDDLVGVRGTYAWLTAALRRHAGDPRVMSVTAWTHPRVTPEGAGDNPYFDARAECWVWGAYARSWQGMDQPALEKMAAAEARGIAGDAYGADLPGMARAELRKNIWAVRWVYHHLQHGGLCLRPPWSMVEHIGFDAAATHAAAATAWANPVLRPAPPVPAIWPEPREHPACRALWQKANPAPDSLPARVAARLPAATLSARRALRRLVPPAVIRRYFRVRWSGDFATWQEARAASAGYDSAAILARVLAATRRVRDGQAAFERDGVAFARPEVNPPVLAGLRQAAETAGGRLGVLDFGGSLGSVYWQHREWLADLESVRWCVVEQPHFVEAGRREFAGEALSFHDSVDACIAAEHPDVLLLSSVLPYLEEPHAFLRGVVPRRFRHILIDRTGIVTRPADRLTVQRVPRSIYPASYPCWFFNRERLLGHFQDDFELVDEFGTTDGREAGLDFKGFHLRRRP